MRRQSIWVLCAVLAVAFGAGCLRKKNRPAAPLSETDYEVAEYVLPGCAPDTTSTAEELVFYCPEQAVFFAVREIRERDPDKVFNAWIEEMNVRAEGKLEVVERSEWKHFGLQYTALYLRMRTPDMPEDGFVEAFVAVTMMNGKHRRLWCTSTSSETTGRQRCEQNLPSMALIDVPK